MPNFKGRCKQGYRKYYKSRKYKHSKSYILTTSTTINQTNDNRNQKNNICDEIDSISRNICNDINSNNCAQNNDITVATTKTTPSFLTNRIKKDNNSNKSVRCHNKKIYSNNTNHINNINNTNKKHDQNDTTTTNRKSNSNRDNDNNNINNTNSNINNGNGNNDGNKNNTLFVNVDDSSLYSISH